MAPTRTLAARRRLMLVVLAVALAAALLFALWRFTGLSEFTSAEAVLDRLRSLAERPSGIAAVIGLYVLAGLTMFPITALIAATGVAFGTVAGIATALGGCLLSGLAGFALGRVGGRRLVRRFGGRVVNRVSRTAARQGVLAVVVLRIMPIAPFTIVNLALGASHLRLVHFVVGTLVGMTPGVVAFAVFGDQVERALRDPAPVTVAVAFAVGAGAIAAGWLANRVVDRLVRKTERSSVTIADSAAAPPHGERGRRRPEDMRRSGERWSRGSAGS